MRAVALPGRACPVTMPDDPDAATGVDHALSSTGDAIVGADILSRVADATADFLRRLT